jgi:hypothetical protein
LPIQLVWFHPLAPKGGTYVLVELVMTLGFALWAAVYGAILFDRW